MHQSRGMVRHEGKRRARRQLLLEDSLIVGLDIGKNKHAAWMIDPSMKPLGKTKIDATPTGIEKLLNRAESTRQRFDLGQVVVALEPTSHFWMLVAKQLESHAVQYLVVHPISVWRGRDIRDYNYAKDDFRDASLLAELAAQMHFTQTRLRPPLWQEMRSLAYERFGLVQMRGRALQETGAHLETVFPNYPVFHRLSGASRAVLSGDPDPVRIRGLSFDQFVAETRQAFEGKRLNASTLKRIYLAAAQSWGMEDRATGSKIRLQLALQRHRLITNQIESIDQRLLKLYQETGYAGIAETMAGITSTTAATLLAFSGDPANYDSGRCLAKMAGTNARENESGEFKGTRSITRRGNPVLRTIAYRAAVSLARNNPEFGERLHYLMHRRDNPLKRRQAYVALANKMLRILHTMWTRKEPYDPLIATGRKPPAVFISNKAH